MGKFETPLNNDRAHTNYPHCTLWFTNNHLNQGVFHWYKSLNFISVIVYNDPLKDNILP